MARDTHRYLIALGSNMRVPGIGGPRAVLAKAFAALEEKGLTLLATSRIVDSRPVGPSQRLYANVVALVETGLEPPALLRTLQGIETSFGRTRRGQRWRARPLDLDRAAKNRAGMGFFRDRRPQLYGRICEDI